MGHAAQFVNLQVCRASCWAHSTSGCERSVHTVARRVGVRVKGGPVAVMWEEKGEGVVIVVALLCTAGATEKAAMA